MCTVASAPRRKRPSIVLGARAIGPGSNSVLVIQVGALHRGGSVDAKSATLTQAHSSAQRRPRLRRTTRSSRDGTAHRGH